MKAAQTVSGAMPQATDPRAVDALDACRRPSDASSSG